MEKKSLPENARKALKNTGEGFLALMADIFSHGDPVGPDGELLSEDIPQRTMEERKYAGRDNIIKKS
jgi:hypothetical protein